MKNIRLTFLLAFHQTELPYFKKNLHKKLRMVQTKISVKPQVGHPMQHEYIAFTS